jgi:thiol-disulfide isomerase/thioredoxin
MGQREPAMSADGVPSGQTHTGQADSAPESPAPADTAHSGDTVESGPAGTGRARRGRPRPAIIIAAAACAALVAAIIAVDSTSHQTRAAAKPPLAPAFTLPSLRDPSQQVSLDAYRGQPVILNFFASWCAPCKKETPLLASFYRSSHNVVIIGVDADDSASSARQFVTAEGITYPVAFETTPALTNAYDVSEIGIPETFFLNSGHHIVKRILGDVTMKELTEDTAMIKPAGSKAGG